MTIQLPKLTQAAPWILTQMGRIKARGELLYAERNDFGCWLTRIAIQKRPRQRAKPLSAVVIKLAQINIPDSVKYLDWRLSQIAEWAICVLYWLWAVSMACLMDNCFPPAHALHLDLFSSNRNIAFLRKPVPFYVP